METVQHNSGGPTPPCLPAGFDWQGFGELLRACFTPLFVQGYDEVNRRALSLGLRVVDRYGLFRDGSTEETEETLAGKIGLVPQARYFLERVLALLEEEQYVTRTSRGYTATPKLRAERLTEAAPTIPPELAADPLFEFFARCEENFPEFFTGKKIGPGIIFAKGDRSFWEALNGESIFFSPYAELAAFAAAELLKSDSAVLEIGAGTGAATGRLLGRIPEGVPASYVYTDITSVFLQIGKRRFHNSKFVEYKTFNMNLPPQEQGFEAGSFDLIYGVNALHVARSLPASLEYLRTLLKPSGRLLIGEGSPPDARRMWRPDLLFGLLEGWWNVELDPILRPRPGWLMPCDWRALFESAGFTNVCALPGEDYFEGDCYGGVVIGENPPAATDESAG
jgi:SAM-dependent methyltransferase